MLESFLGIGLVDFCLTSRFFKLCLSFAFRVLRRFLPEEKVEAVKGLTLTADGRGAVFDVPAEDLDSLLAGTFPF